MYFKFLKAVQFGLSASGRPLFYLKSAIIRNAESFTVK